jgi:hypothetical protein
VRFPRRTSRRSGAALRLVLVVASLMIGLLPAIGLAEEKKPQKKSQPAPARTVAPGGAAAGGRDVRFGLNEAWRAADTADRTGAGWSRVLFWWSEFQKTGPDDFDLYATDHDAYIDGELERGRELAAAVLNTPGWASTDGSRNGVPRNLALPWDHPDNHWGRFMRRLAEHYRGRIDTWIIWNEVDIRNGQWSTWNGSPEEYIQLLKVAYRAIKAGNPQAKVLPFGAAWWYDRGDYLTRLLDLLAADPEARANNHFFDVANLHLYSRASDIPRVIGWYREQLAARGMSKPLWVAETNAVPYDDAVWPAGKANFRATLDEQASYIVQAFASYLGLKVDRISVNRAVDGTDFEAGGEPFGLIRNNGTTRPAFAAYQVVTRYFSRVRDATYVPTDESGLTRVVLLKENERITVAWTIRPQPLSASLEATGPRALRVSKSGEASVIEAQGGRYRVELGAATANSNEHDPRDYVVGGEPVILVERRDGDPRAAFRPIN